MKRAATLEPAADWHPLTVLGAPASAAAAAPSVAPGPAARLFAPRGVYLGRVRGQDVLVVADTGHHRVLIWYGLPERHGERCDVVVGQPDERGDGPAAGTGDTRAGLCLPAGVLVREGRLIVADTWHHRVLVYDRLPQRPGARPDLILGQAEADSVTPNRGGECGPGTLYWPSGLAVAGGRFYVADSGNHRVLGWTGGLPERPDTPPDVVLGQPGPVSGAHRTANRGGLPGPGGLRWPHGIAGGADDLYVADTGNHRVLGWTAPPGPDTPARLVLGQPDLGTATERLGPRGPAVLGSPFGVSADGAIVAVADAASGRVLFWDRPAVTSRAASPASGPPLPAAVLSPALASQPYALSLAGGRLAVADSAGNQVVIWGKD